MQAARLLPAYRSQFCSLNVAPSQLSLTLRCCMEDCFLEARNDVFELPNLRIDGVDVLEASW